ncbi:MAG: AAA family ATPase [Pirellulales bacterium]|nr:AAA family ATPase [Pirellulales bacterium]
MGFNEDAIRALREALEISPENEPLRRHLAGALAGLGRFEEAELEYRQALNLSPLSTELKIELAKVYFQQGKLTQSLVIVEDVTSHPNPPGKAHVLHAHLLLRRGDVPNAVALYKLGVEIDPSAADQELSERLGIASQDRAGAVFEGRVRECWEEPSSASSAEVERPKATFRDVGGMEALKEEIAVKIIYPLQHPEVFQAYGKSVGGGILMYGPPGCGKTHLARATAGEIRAGFISVGINDVLEMWMGNSERNLHALFEQARDNKPCVLFFDEVDALGGRRSDMHGGAGRQLINQFLAEMDGVNCSNEGVLILAASNAPWHVDPAFRRPGRFDRILFVPPPDAPGRAAILRIHCAGKPAENLDFEHVAKKTDGFSGADLKAVVDMAVENKLRQAMRSGNIVLLATKDLAAAAQTLRPTTREWFSTARNYATYSNQGGLYDDVLKYLKIG